MVMVVFCRRLCVRFEEGRLVCTELGKGAKSDEAGKSLFRAANVWWMCAQYCVIASCD